MKADRPWSGHNRSDLGNYLPGAGYVGAPRPHVVVRAGPVWISCNPRSGAWKAIADVHALADAEEAVPLGIDRLLYLAGSGRYVGGSGISTPQAGRYRAPCKAAWQITQRMRQAR